MKKLLLLLCLLLLLTSCSKRESITKEVLIEGSIFSGQTEKPVELTVTYNDDWLTKNKNAVYNKDLAGFSAILAADSYFREKDVAKNTQNRVLVKDSDKEYSFTSLLEEFGFSDTQHIESYKMHDYQYDTNDSITMNLGYKNVDDKYDVFVVVVRGCFSAGEWTSIFDVGYDMPEYGFHPEWANNDNFKGFDISKNRGVEYINEYLQKHDDLERENTMLITGHSKGGSISNLLNDYYQARGVKTYTYCFNNMAVTEQISDSKSVFNIIDNNDLYTKILPFASVDAKRYGLDKTNEKLDMNKLVKEYFPDNDYCYLDNDKALQYQQLFQQIFTDRKSLYEQKEYTISFEDIETAQTTMETYQQLITPSNLGLEDYISYKINENEVSLTINYCDAAILTGLAKIICYGSPANDGMKTLFYFNQTACQLFDIVNDNISQINAGHLLLNTYIISQNQK